MKINLYVDVAYAFDFLSILELKSKKIKDKESLKNYKTYKNQIKEQISESLFNNIIKSKYYKKLYKINSNIWKSTNKSVSSRESIIELNIARWKTKNDIQKIFFNNNIFEQKCLK